MTQCGTFINLLKPFDTGLFMPLLCASVCLLRHSSDKSTVELYVQFSHIDSVLCKTLCIYEATDN